MELHGGAGLRTPCPGHVSKPVPRPIHTDMALALPRPLPSAISQDFCPHRLAPLSEGRVEADGQLLCAYHGWRFDSTGKCTDLPQVSVILLLEAHRSQAKADASWHVRSDTVAYAREGKAARVGVGLQEDPVRGLLPNHGEARPVVCLAAGASQQLAERW